MVGPSCSPRRALSRGRTLFPAAWVRDWLGGSLSVSLGSGPGHSLGHGSARALGPKLSPSPDLRDYLHKDVQHLSRETLSTAVADFGSRKADLETQLEEDRQKQNKLREERLAKKAAAKKRVALARAKSQSQGRIRCELATRRVNVPMTDALVRVGVCGLR